MSRHRNRTIDSTEIAEPDTKAMRQARGELPPDPTRPPLGDGKHCEACGEFSETIAWRVEAKRYECGECPDVAPGVIPRSEPPGHVRRCGTCGRPMAITAPTCSHCTSPTGRIEVENIATPARIRADDRPGLPWMRGAVSGTTASAPAIVATLDE